MDSAPLPRGWTHRIKSSVLNAIALISAALTESRLKHCPPAPLPVLSVLAITSAGPVCPSADVDKFAESIVRGAIYLSRKLTRRFV